MVTPRAKPMMASSGCDLSAAVRPYHHGSLPQALLASTEKLLTLKGIHNLTLRGVALDAGVSHTAPQHHFGDMRGMLSELAALGFLRLRDAMLAGVAADMPPRKRIQAISRGYVAFARGNPDLFRLMFRADALDTSRPALQTAMDTVFTALHVAKRAKAPEEAGSRTKDRSLASAAELAGGWALMHGLAMLAIDGRLQPALARAPFGTDATALVSAALDKMKVKKKRKR